MGESCEVADQKLLNSCWKWFYEQVSNKNPIIFQETPTSPTKNTGFSSFSLSSSPKSPGSWVPAKPTSPLDSPISLRSLKDLQKVSILLVGPSNMGKATLLNTLFSTHQHLSPWSLSQKQASKHRQDSIRCDFRLDLDSTFFEKYDEEQEKESNKNRSNYFLNLRSGLPLSIDDEHSFLIPQGVALPTLSFRFGLFYEIYYKYWDESRIREDLFTLIKQIHHHSKNNSHKPCPILVSRYSKLLSACKFKVNQITSASDITFPDYIQEVVGKSFRFCGDGKAPEKDRIFVRNTLKKITQNLSSLVEELVVKLPCSLLKENTEITLSDSDNPCQFARVNIKQKNLCLVTIDDRGITNDLKEILCSASFRDTFCGGRESHHNLVLLPLLERSSPNFDPNLVKIATLHQFKSMYQANNINLPESYYSNLPVLGLKPLLFNSLFFCFDLPLQVDDLPLKDWKNMTCLPSLISIIHNTRIRIFGSILKQVNDIWATSVDSSPKLGKRRNGTVSSSLVGQEESKKVPSSNNFNFGLTNLKNVFWERSGSRRKGTTPIRMRTEDSYPVVITPIMVAGSREFSKLMQEWKAQVTEAECCIRNQIFRVAGSSIERATKSWNEIRHRYLGTEEVCGVVFDKKYQGECTIFNLLEFYCQEMIFSGPQDWKISVWDPFHQRAKLVMTSALKPVQECMTILESSAFGSTPENIRVREFLQCHKAVIERQTSIRLLSINAELSRDIDLVLQTCRSIVFSKLIQKANEFTNVSDFQNLSFKEIPLVPIEVANLVMRRYSDVIGEYIRQIDELEEQYRSMMISALQNLSTSPSSQSNHYLTYPFLHSSTGSSSSISTTSTEPNTPSTLNVFEGSSSTASSTLATSSTPTSDSPQLVGSSIDSSFSMSDSLSLIQSTRSDLTLSPSKEFENSNIESSLTRKDSSLDLLSEQFAQMDIDHLGMSRSFEERLKDFMELFQVQTDDSCQYRAISHQVYGSENVHELVRYLVMFEILSNVSFYQSFLPVAGLDIHQYVYGQSKAREWGHPLSLTAASNFYGVDIVVYVPSRHKPYEKCKISSRKRKTHQILLMAWLGENLYYSLKPAEQGDDSLDHARKRLSHRNIDSPDSPETSNSVSPPTFVPKKVNKPPKSPPRMVPRLLSLTEICFEAILENRQKIQEIKGRLPEDVLQQLISRCIATGRIDSSSISFFVDPSMYSLSFDNCLQLTDLCCKTFSKECINLRKLSLSKCKNIGSVGLASIAAHCKDLTFINLSGCCQITNSGIQDITRSCVNLLEVDLSCCPKITDEAIQSLWSRCPNLHSVNFSFLPKLTDNAFRNIGAEMLIIDISSCPQLTNITLDYISKNCEQLTTLKMANNKNIWSPGLCSISSRCSNITTLDLQGCDNVGDLEANALLTRCLRLSILILSGCKKVGNFLGKSEVVEICKTKKGSSQLSRTPGASTQAPIVSPPSKYSLSYSRTPSGSKIEPSTGGSSSSLPTTVFRLMTLELSKCSGLTNDSLISLCQSLPYLHTLSLSSCNQISDKSISIIGQSCRHIRWFSIANCIKITDESISQVVKEWPNLISLNLRNCPSITDVSITQISQYCVELKELDISCCPHLTPACLVSLAQRKSLQSLCLEELFRPGRQEAVEEAFSILFESIDQLKTVNITHCSLFNDKCLDSLSKNCKTLQYLDLSFCNQISMKDLQLSLNKWPNLRQLHLRGYNQMLTELHHPRLEVLNASWCSLLHDQGLVNIGNGCPSLISVSLSWCSKLTSVGIEGFIKSKCSTTLRVLDIRGCTLIHNATLKKLMALRHLTICHGCSSSFSRHNISLPT